MKKFMILLLIVMFITPVFAEEDLIDEYVTLVREGEFTRESLDLFNSKYDHKALSLFLEGHVLISEYDYASAYQVLESVVVISENDVYPILEIESLSYLATIDYLFYDSLSALRKSFKMKESAEKNNYKIGIVDANYNIADGYIEESDFTEASLYAKEALELSESIDYELGVYNYYLFLWYLEYMSWNEETSYDYLLEAESYNNNRDLYNRFFNIEQSLLRTKATTLYWIDKKEERIKLLVDLLPEIDSDNHLIRSYILYNLGYYSADINPESSLEYYEDALIAYEQVKSYDVTGYYKNLLNEGLAYGYFGIGEFESSANYFYETSEYYYSEQVNERTIDTREDLDAYKFTEMKEQVTLLELLAIEKTEKLNAKNKLLSISIVSILVLTIMLIIIIFEIKSKNKAQKRLYKLSTTDSLTQVFNRGRIIEIFENKLENNNAVLLLDLDNFKEINDNFGHVVGDQVLKVIAEILKESVRSADAVGRYGGEEFLIVLDSIGEEELLTVSERIRAGLEEHSWSYEGLTTTCSIGVCNIYSDDADEILHHVDQLMYQAKLGGKNRVIFG